MAIKLTLNKIKEHSPCEKGWKNLLKSLNKTKSDDTEVSFGYIAENNSVSDSLWCLRCINESKYRKEIFLLCADIAESVLYIYESKYPNDLRVKECIEATRDFALGKISIEELILKRAGAYAATSHAAHAAAADAAYAAATSHTAHAAAAAADAADAAADADAVYERKKQVQIIKEYLG